MKAIKLITGMIISWASLLFIIFLFTGSRISGIESFILGSLYTLTLFGRYFDIYGK